MRTHWTARRLFGVIATVIVLCVSALLAWTFRESNEPVNYSQYRRIQLGMTKVEATAVIGRPPDSSHSHLPELIDLASDPPPGKLLDSMPHSAQFWLGDSRVILITLNTEGQINAKYFRAYPEANLLRRWRDWLRR